MRFEFLRCAECQDRLVLVSEIGRHGDSGNNGYGFLFFGDITDVRLIHI